MKIVGYKADLRGYSYACADGRVSECDNLGQNNNLAVGYYLSNYLNKMKSSKTALKHKSVPQQAQQQVSDGIR